MFFSRYRFRYILFKKEECLMSKWRKFVYFLALANGEQLPAEIVKELLNVNWKIMPIMA